MCMCVYNVTYRGQDRDDDDFTSYESIIVLVHAVCTAAMVWEFLRPGIVAV